jgi:hypothetical protein
MQVICNFKCPRSVPNFSLIGFFLAAIRPLDTPRSVKLIRGMSKRMRVTITCHGNFRSIESRRWSLYS